MEVSYSADLSDIDNAVHLAKAERPGKSIRLRFQPAVFRLKPHMSDGSGTYQGWKSVAWSIECPEPADAIAVREALRVFFESVGVFGAPNVQTYLQQAIDQQEQKRA